MTQPGSERVSGDAGAGARDAQAVAAGEVECVGAPIDPHALLQLFRHGPPGRDGVERPLALSGRPPRL